MGEAVSVGRGVSVGVSVGVSLGTVVKVARGVGVSVGGAVVGVFVGARIGGRAGVSITAEGTSAGRVRVGGIQTGTVGHGFGLACVGDGGQRQGEK